MSILEPAVKFNQNMAAYMKIISYTIEIVVIYKLIECFILVLAINFIRKSFKPLIVSEKEYDECCRRSINGSSLLSQLLTSYEY